MRVEQEIVNKYTVTAGVLSYPVTFPLYEESDVSVVVSSDGGESESALTLGTDYSVSINEDNSGGTVTLVSGVVQNGDSIALSSNLPYTQELDLSSVSTIDTNSAETQLDRTTQQIQQIAEQALRSVKVPVTSTTTPEEYMAAFWEAAKEVLASVGIVKDAEEYIRRFVAGIPLIRSNLSEVEDGPDGLYWVTGFGDAGKPGHDISNRLVVADGSTEARTLGERAADIINVKDFGAKGDGVTDDTAAWEKFQEAEGGVKYIPAGDYLVNETVYSFTSGVIGNGVFKDIGYWTQIQGKNRDTRTIIKHYANVDVAKEPISPVFRTQAEFTINNEDPAKAYNYTRVIGPYHEAVGSGNFAWEADNKTGNVTVLAATAHNKFAGQFGMTAVTGRTWDAKESEVPEIENLGASKSCSGYFPFTRRAKYKNGGYMIGIETYCMNTSDDDPEQPYENNDSHVFDSWTAGYHCTGTSNNAPITDAILIDGSKTAKFGFWNGIVIGGSAMKIKGQAGYPGTVGLNFSSWTTNSCGDIAIKFGYANRHLYFKQGARIESILTRLINGNGAAGLSIESASNASPYISFKTGATSEANPSSIQVAGIGIAGDSFYLKSENGEVQLHANGGKHIYKATSERFSSASDADKALGNASTRWAQVFAASGSINTSDANEKQSIEAYPDAVLDAWGEVEFRQFLFNDAVEKKGDAARIHAGVIAQQVVQAFERHHVDATKYGLLCYDEWEAEYKDVEVVDVPASELIVDENGNPFPAQTHTEKVQITKAGSRYGIRYSEALCLEAAYQRRRADRIEQRLNAIEALMTMRG